MKTRSEIVLPVVVLSALIIISTIGIEICGSWVDVKETAPATAAETGEMDVRLIICLGLAGALFVCFCCGLAMRRKNDQLEEEVAACQFRIIQLLQKNIMLQERLLGPIAPASEASGNREFGRQPGPGPGPRPGA